MNSIYFLAVISLALLGSATAEPEQLLKDLCSLDAKPFVPEITRISDAKHIIESLNGDQSADCPANVKTAILALEPVINLENVCSEEAADAIVEFWANYVDKKSKLRKDLPKPLKNFFLGFGLQVSKVCKSIMINELEKVSKDEKITVEDIQFVTKRIKENEKVKSLFGEEPKIEDLTIIISTNAAAQIDKKMMNLPPKHMKYFELMQERCLYKFKPIYDTLVSPIVRLASIGLNYKPVESFDAFLKEPIFYDWFNIIVACEPYAEYEAVLIPAYKLNAYGRMASITVLDKVDIAELQQKTGLTLREPKIIEPIDYKVEVRLTDQIIDNDDAPLIKSIENYGKGFSEIIKLRWRLIKRVPSILRFMIKNRKIQFGLKPVETKDPGKSIMSRKSKLRLMVAVAAFSLIGLAITGIILGHMFAGPLFPIPLIIAACIISLTFVVGPVIYVTAPE